MKFVIFCIFCLLIFVGVAVGGFLAPDLPQQALGRTLRFVCYGIGGVGVLVSIVGIIVGIKSRPPKEPQAE